MTLSRYVLILVLIPLLCLSAAAAAKPGLVLLSNDIDYELNQELISFLNVNFEVTRIGHLDFPKHKGSQRIIVLGGPDAKDTGGFAGEVLEPPWQGELRKNKGERNIYPVGNKWGTTGQLILVVAGNTRYDTQAAAAQEKENIVSLLNSKTPFSSISVEEVNGKMATGSQGYTLLDVRSRNAFDTGHLKNALNIPYPELKWRYTELDSSKEILTYCQNGKIGALAAQDLMNKGFEKVYNMQGGIDLWKERFGAESLEVSVKQPVLAKPGVFKLENGGSLDFGSVRISFIYYNPACGTAEEYLLTFINIEKGKPVGSPVTLTYSPELKGLPSEITDEVHSRGFLPDYRINVPQWGETITIDLQQK